MKHNPKLTKFAQELRKNLTKEERLLWYVFLNSYPFRFRRQVTVGIFILDFYCAAAKLAIELDGSQHFTVEGKKHDAKRTIYLQSLGIKVLRFSNWDVMSKFDYVCAIIHQTVQQRIAELNTETD